MGQLEQAVEDYEFARDCSEKVRYTWPLGLGLFYLERYSDVVNQLESDITYFEGKFGDSATDERIFRAASLMHLARLKGEPLEGVAESIQPLEIKEPTFLRRTVHELFRGQASAQDVEAVISGEEGKSFDYLGTRFYGQFFLGLWYDACGEEVDLLGGVQLRGEP
ncbi:unnamed protein product [Choristocarpus tenellus]